MSIGLSSPKASELLTKFGSNTLPEQKRAGSLTIFFSQFKSTIILILLLAALLSFIISDPLDGSFILGVVFLNALFGFIQEYRAEKALSALKKLVVHQIRVFRDGKETLLETKYLVPGDIIIIEEGNRIPADCRILEASELEIDESSLTGESLPVIKNSGQEEESLLFMGTTILKGHGQAEVLFTGVETKFGKIAAQLTTITEEKTPLQIQLDNLGKVISYAVIIITFMVFILGIARHLEILTMLFTSISLAVAVIPEGLPAVITITLALGMQRMARRNAIVRKLTAIETLGAATLICTDKTGTLTKNEMQVRHIWTDFKLQNVHPKNESTAISKLMQIAILANNANLISTETEPFPKIIGDKTEGALLLMADEMGFLDKDYGGQIEEEFPFDSLLKTMTVVWKKGDERQIFSKGAPEVILDNCQRIFSEGKITSLSQKQKEEIVSAFTKEAGTGARVLAFGFKETNQKEVDRQKAGENLVFVGFVSIADPLRSEIKDAVNLARQAGIRTVMITGDNSETARAIAYQADIIGKNGAVITGTELENLNDRDLESTIQKVSVYARISPLQKQRLIIAYQHQGEIVAVTGDGVNDVLSLKQANIGIAMGRGGTDVARQASDIVLSDDNYASLIAAVEEGRVIYDNILKALKYLLSSNFSELLIIIIAVFLGMPLPLTPIQILWINLISDSFPALALATDPKDPLVMKKLPRDKTQGIVKMLNPIWLAKTGLIIASLTTLGFMISLYYLPLPFARAIAFNLLIIFQIGLAFIVRYPHHWHTNPRLLLSITVIGILQLIIITNESLRKIFEISVLP